MKILEELKFATIFFTGCFIMFFAIQSVKAQTYGEYINSLSNQINNCSEHFSGGSNCNSPAPPTYTSCTDNEYFSGGECEPINIMSCAVYEDGNLYIDSVDVIISNKVYRTSRLKFIWNGSAFGLSK